MMNRPVQAEMSSNPPRRDVGSGWGRNGDAAGVGTGPGLDIMAVELTEVARPGRIGAEAAVGMLFKIIAAA